MKKRKRVLAVVAHPDDEVLGIGGTLIRLNKEYGYEVHILFMTIPLTVEDSFKWDKAAKSANILKCSWSCVPDHTQMYPLSLDSQPIAELVECIEVKLNEYKPEILLTHHIGDLNQDHRAVAESCLIATRPSFCPYLKKVYTFDTPSSTEWSFGEFQKFEPNTYVDISKCYSLKEKALKVYDDEIKNLKFPHPRSLEALRHSSKVKGSRVGLRETETLKLIRSSDFI